MSNTADNIIAVVVTYNRLDLLKRCLKSLQEQTLALKKTIVVDNCSTDGTTGYLKSIAPRRPDLEIITLPENIGGAGGFETGMKAAVELGAGYVWIMDDDTLPQPGALQQLMDVVAANPETGFAASRVEWTDGNMHLMNKPIITDKKEYLAIENATSPVRCKAATFVSLLVPSSVIEKIGLPIGEFFIWHDDIEYTSRITKAGFKGYFVPASVVVHATASNRGATIEDAPYGTERRFYYQIRNYIATKRLHSNRLKAYVSGFLKYRRMKRRIARRSDHRKEFMINVKRGFHDGLHFHPTVPRIKQ